jgi:hypothetical protein
MKDLWEHKTQYQRKDEHTPEEFYDRERGLNWGKLCVFLWGILSAKSETSGLPLFERKLKSERF